MASIEQHLIALIAELKALREAVVAQRNSSRSASPRAVKPSTLAADLGRHPRTVIRAIEDGRISSTPCGRSWSISRLEAERIKRDGLGAPQKD